MPWSSLYAVAFILCLMVATCLLSASFILSSVLFVVSLCVCRNVSPVASHIYHPFGPPAASACRHCIAACRPATFVAQRPTPRFSPLATTSSPWVTSSLIRWSSTAAGVGTLRRQRPPVGQEASPPVPPVGTSPPGRTCHLARTPSPRVACKPCLQQALRLCRLGGSVPPAAFSRSRLIT